MSKWNLQTYLEKRQNQYFINREGGGDSSIALEQGQRFPRHFFMKAFNERIELFDILCEVMRILSESEYGGLFVVKGGFALLSTAPHKYVTSYRKRLYKVICKLNNNIS